MYRYRLLLLLVMACCHPNPRINAFHVTPAGYCPSGTQKIHIDWDTAKGNTTLQIAPDDAKPRSVAARGSTEFPAHDVTVTLTVSSGALHPHVIQPVRAVDHHTLNSLATEAGGGKCQDGWVTADPAEFGGGPNAFAADAHPSVISNKCGAHATSTATCRRNVKVQHAGLTWKLAPNSALDVISSAAPMAGSWVLSQELLPGEQCGSESAKGAIEVDLSLEIDCTKGVSYEQ
jgi:hypothetical protein